MDNDRQARAQLLLDQEDAEREIAQVEGELKKASAIYLTLGEKLRAYPDDVVFSNAPDNLGSVPIEYLRKQSIDWDAIPDIRRVAQLLQNLRTMKSQLREIKHRLG
jgi:hypothetical protein